jgi:drug/metabolite transporter (DMT)-like permease
MMTRMAYVLGKILEVVALLTLGVALFVYGFGEENMTAELGWLLLGSLVFVAGYVLERRSSRGG